MTTSRTCYYRLGSSTNSLTCFHYLGLLQFDISG